MSATAPAASEPERIGTFSALRIRDFRLLLFGTTLSNAAQWIQQVTLGWLVYDLTGSGTALGTINLVRGVASVGLNPVAGTAIDRIERRRLMIATQAWLFAITITLALLVLFGHVQVWYLFVFAFLGGAPRRSTSRSARPPRSTWSPARSPPTRSP
jgi:MFS family permease